MDSGNSNSLQSSSGGGGGEEEYDSRADHSISSFLNNNNYTSPAPAPALHHQQQLHPYSLFDHSLSSANYSFDPSPSSRLLSSSSSQLPNNSSLLNLDMVWSKSLRSDPNCTDLGVSGLFMNPSTTATSTTTSLFSPSSSSTAAAAAAFPSPKASSFLAPPASSSGGPTGLNTEHHHQQQQGHYNNNSSQSQSHSNHHVVRNPKKRSRASRRAPTTVLTTDTTNFRAMVQEFTGIPAPPFTASSSLHFPRSSRLNDLFGTGINNSSPSPPSYLLRPFAHKLINSNPMQSSASSSSSSSIAATNNIFSNYQHQQNLLNSMQNNNPNPLLNLHSLLQLPPRHPLSNESKSSSSALEDQLGLSQHANLMSGLQSWPAAGTTPPAVGSNESNADHHHHHHQEPAAGLFANAQASSSEFQRDKAVAGANNVNVATAATTPSTRTEGMVVESWIN